MTTTDTQPRRCIACAAEFDAPGADVAGLFVAFRHHCPTCYPAAEVERLKRFDESERRTRAARWAAVCPPEFATVDRAMLPRPDLFDSVQGWNYGPRGLVVAGNTGLGKTRSCWQVIKREVMAGRSFFCLSSYDLSNWAYSLCHEPLAHHAIVRHVVSANILYLDDPFKARLTPTVEESLFVTLDERTARRKPTLFSFNDSGATMMARMTSDRGPAFLRRIKDFCDVITFK